MNDEQLLRYARHILLDEIGIEGQEKLLAARVLIVGAGSPPGDRGVRRRRRPGVSPRARPAMRPPFRRAGCSPPCRSITATPAFGRAAVPGLAGGDAFGVLRAASAGSIRTQGGAHSPWRSAMAITTASPARPGRSAACRDGAGRPGPFLTARVSAPRFT